MAGGMRAILLGLDEYGGGDSARHALGYDMNA
jgi:hypothetical protein